MITTLTHRAEIVAMNLVIEVLKQTRRSDSICQMIVEIYNMTKGKPIILWLGAICATGIAGFLSGYIGYFSIPR